jgi:hypothetical protein
VARKKKSEVFLEGYVLKGRGQQQDHSDLERFVQYCVQKKKRPASATLYRADAKIKSKENKRKRAQLVEA